MPHKQGQTLDASRVKEGNPCLGLRRTTGDQKTEHERTGLMETQADVLVPTFRSPCRCASCPQAQKGHAPGGHHAQTTAGRQDLRRTLKPVLLTQEQNGGEAVNAAR